MKLKIGITTTSLIVLYFLLSSYTFSQDITNITANFCNEGKLTEHLNISTDSAKTNEICIQFGNSSDKDISIIIGFPDGTVTNDSFKNKACKTEGNIQEFGKYITQKNKSLIIPAGETIIEKNYIKLPAGFDGIVHGCMTYFLDNKNGNSSDGVNIVVRQTSYIDILVGSNFKRDTIIKDFTKINHAGSNKKINTESNLDSSLSIKLLFDNNGDIDESFQGSGIIYGLFGFSKQFEIPKTTLQSNTTKEIEINIGTLPFYGGIFRIQISGTISPEIIFNKDSLAKELKEDIHINQQSSIKIIPRSIIIGLMVFIIIFFSIRKFKKRESIIIYK